MQKFIAAVLSLVFLGLSAQATLRCEDLWVDVRLRSDKVETIPARNLGPGFIVPNEYDLGVHKASFAKIPEGIYLTVGTERGLMSSALSQGSAKALIQVDRDDKVVLFNLVNRALLAISKNREHYLQLRLHSSHSQWLAALEKTKKLSLEDRQTLSRFEAWQWWKEMVQDLSSWQSFHRDPQQNPDRAYLEANYLFSDILFARVSGLAKQHRIFILHDSLGAETFRSRVQEISEALDLKLAAVDMSNAWQEGYLGHEKTIQFLESLKPQMNLETRFVFTFMAKAQTQAASIFKYLFTDVSQHVSSNEIAMMLANMACIEPSQSPNPRSRVNRFDDF